MSGQRLLGAAGSLLALAFGCGVDGRSLSYEVSALGSAPGHAGSDTAGDAQNPMGGASGIAGENSGGSLPGAAGAPVASAGEAGAPPTQGGTASMNEAGAPSQSGSANTGGMAGSVGAGGDAAGGVPTMPEPDPYPCGDLNIDGIDDCGQSLVQNPSFDQNSTGWVSEGSLVQAWLQEDARGANASGSVSLSNTNVVAGATGLTGLASHQCIFAWSGDPLAVSARVRIAGQQSAGQAGVNVTFFGGDDCEGALLGAQDLAFTATSGKWVRVSGRLVVPAATRSASVRLMVQKPFEAPSFEARFDDVVVLKP